MLFLILDHISVVSGTGTIRCPEAQHIPEGSRHTGTLVYLHPFFFFFGKLQRPQLTPFEAKNCWEGNNNKKILVLFFLACYSHYLLIFFNSLIFECTGKLLLILLGMPEVTWQTPSDPSFAKQLSFCLCCDHIYKLHPSWISRNCSRNTYTFSSYPNSLSHLKIPNEKKKELVITVKPIINTRPPFCVSVYT